MIEEFSGKEQQQLSPVARTTDLDELFDVDPRLLRGRLDGCILCLLGSPPGQIVLMLLALRVGQVRRLVVVQGQAQLTLISAKMVAHKVGICKGKKLP